MQDYVGESASCVIAGADILVAPESDHMYKVVAFYDNEWGYSSRLVDLIRVMAYKDGVLGREVDIVQCLKNSADNEGIRSCYWMGGNERSPQEWAHYWKPHSALLKGYGLQQLE